MATELDAAIAAWLRDTETLLAAVRGAEPARWQAPSANPGWSNKDLLTHLATGYMQRLTLLQSIVATGAPGALPDADAANAARIAEHRNSEVEDLIAELIATRAEVLRLLRRMPENRLGEPVQIGGRSVRLGDYLRELSRHDLDHLDELLSTPPGETGR